jgi:hypothetical protein
MPQYIYRNPKTGKFKEVIQRMTEPHVYSEDGVEWERIFTIPQAAMDTILDPFKAEDFNKKTSKPGTMGELYDRAQEMSEKRKDKDGVDVITNKHWQDWSKKRKGRKPPKKVFEI